MEGATHPLLCTTLPTSLHNGIPTTETFAGVKRGLLQTAMQMAVAVRHPSTGPGSLPNTRAGVGSSGGSTRFHLYLRTFSRIDDERQRLDAVAVPTPPLQVQLTRGWGGPNATVEVGDYVMIRKLTDTPWACGAQCAPHCGSEVKKVVLMKGSDAARCEEQIWMYRSLPLTHSEHEAVL